MNHEQREFRASIDEYDPKRVVRDTADAVGDAHILRISTPNRVTTLASQVLLEVAQRYGVTVEHRPEEWLDKITICPHGRYLVWHIVTDNRPPDQIVRDIETARARRPRYRVESWGVEQDD